MIIESLNIIAFGKLKNKKITFSDKLNVIYGRNESGKTTVSAFIEAMLYSLPKKADRDRYFPWDNSKAAGEITIRENGQKKTVYREFGKSAKSDVIEPRDFSFGDSIPPTREAYRLSAYCPEGKSSDFSDVGKTNDFEARIANITQSGNEDFNISDAIERLKNARKKLVAERGGGGDLNEVKIKIDNLNNELVQSKMESERIKSVTERLVFLKNQQKEYEEKAHAAEASPQNTLSEQLDEINLKINELSGIIASFPMEKSPTFSKPEFWDTSLIFYILCTLLTVIIGFVVYIPLLFAAILPALVYFAVFALKMHKFRKNEAEFLSHVNCASFDEYNKKISDKKLLEKELEDVLGQKVLLLTQSRSADERVSIYKTLNSIKDDIAHLEASARRMMRPVGEITSELEYQLARKEELEKKYAALTAAMDGLKFAQARISTDFTPKITKKAMEYLDAIAPKEGREVAFSEDMKIILTDPFRVDISHQSFGFREEIYLAFRLAWSEFLYGKSFPLILDDPFLGSDDYREKAIFDLLKKLSEDRQIIIFTNRKNDYFTDLDGKWVDIDALNDV